MPRMLLRPGWILTHVMVIAIAIGLANLGLWQLRRAAEVRDDNARVEVMIASDPEPLTSSSIAVLQEFQPVTLQGHYLTDEDVALSPRSRNDRPGFEVLTPFVTTAGPTVLVNRGWAPLETEAPPADAGPVRLDGRVRLPAESRRNLTAADGTIEQVSGVDPALLAGQSASLSVDIYVERVDEAARAAGTIPRPSDPPSLSNGNHFSYALQWFAFMVIGLVGYPLLLRRRISDAAEQATTDDRGSRHSESATVSKYPHPSQ